MSTTLTIAGRRIGPGCQVYVVAEMSANHNRDFEQAVRLVHAAREAGADAVKLQTYTPDTITLRSDREHFRIGGGTLWDGKTLHDLYAEAAMPWEWQPKLKKVADELGLHLFSSAFDSTAVDFLEKMNVPAHKVASFELVDIPLIEKMARTGKPLIMSTGMATLEEIEEAVAAARAAGASEIALLKCTSAYPSPPEEMNLRTIADLARRFEVPVGLSDHTLGIHVAVAAVALGACIVEKHLTLSRGQPSPDSAFSLEPDEFRSMVEAIRAAERAVGDVHYGAGKEEAKSRAFRRSLFVVEDVKAGEKFTEKNVRSIRPAHGLHPRHLPEVLGRAAACDIPAGTPLKWAMVEKPVVAKSSPRVQSGSSEEPRFRTVPLEPGGYAEWDCFCLESDDAWFWHTSEWLQYTLDYRPELKPRSVSFALKSDGRIVGICPLILEQRPWKKRAVAEFSFGGDAGPAPALASGTSERMRRDISKALLRHLDGLAEQHGVARASFRYSPLAPRFWTSQGSKPNPMGRLGFLDISIATQVLDLANSPEQLLREMRKGHRADIARGEAVLQVEVFNKTNISTEVFEAYRALHAKAAGRVTRPLETFERMHAWIREGNAILCRARAQGADVGFALVSVYKDGAYYSSSCEDPEAGRLPVGHQLQWKVIEWLCHHRIRRYEIGHQFYGPLPHLPVGEKESRISFFKRGFGGQPVACWCGEKFFSADYYRGVAGERANSYAQSLAERASGKQTAAETKS